MATPTITGLTRITAAEAADSASWVDITSGPGSGQDVDLFIQGAESRGRRMNSTALKGFWFDVGAGNEINMTESSGNNHLWMWILTVFVSQTQSRANGGIRIRVGSTTANYHEWYVGGNDVTPPEWQRYCLDVTKDPSNIGGSGLNLSSCRYFGAAMIWNTAPGGNVNHMQIDAIDYGDGIVVTGGVNSDPLTWDDIEAVSNSTTNRYGAIEKRDGVFFLNGSIQIGDDRSSLPDTYLQDQDQILVWKRQEYDALTSFGVVASVEPTFHQLSIVGDASSTTSFIDGVGVGLGESTNDRDATGRNGSLFVLDVDATANDLTMDMNNPDVDTLNLYGSKFQRVTRGVTFADTATANGYDIYGCVFDQCGRIGLGSPDFRGCVFSGTTQEDSLGTGLGTGDSAARWSTNTDIINCSFIANTDSPTPFNPHAIQHPAAGSFTYDGLRFSANDYDIEFSASSGSLTISAVNLANPATYEITSGGTSVTIQNDVTLTVTVQDTAGDPIQNAQTAIYRTSDNTELLNDDTNASGIATTTFNYPGSDVPVYIRVRKNDTDGNFIPVSANATVEDTGLSVTITLRLDTVAA